jgi:hypothetical protein
MLQTSTRPVLNIEISRFEFVSDFATIQPIEANHRFHGYHGWFRTDVDMTLAAFLSVLLTIKVFAGGNDSGQ